MKVLITGANGLLGQKLVALYNKQPHVEVIATSKINQNSNNEHHILDITSLKAVNTLVSKTSPDVIINTAAMTAVDTCESKKDTCWKVNVDAVQYLIEASKKNNCFLIHLSTDFIFDGASGPYKEVDRPNPLSYYAKSKLASEDAIIQSNISYAIVRTMLVYGYCPMLTRSNIVLWIIKNLKEGKKISVVNDQYRMPTLAEDLASGCAGIAEKKSEGIFHISGKNFLTPYDMALQVADVFELDANLIEKTDGSKFKQLATRPKKTGFILEKAKSILDYTPVSFIEGLNTVKSQITPSFE